MQRVIETLRAGIAVALVGSAIGWAGEPPLAATPREAVALALADQNAAPAEAQPFLRYVWIPAWGDVDWIRAVNFGVNAAVSQNSVIVYPGRTASPFLVRWDLRILAPGEAPRRRLVANWERLAATEPYFHANRAGSGAAGRTQAAIVLAEHAGAGAIAQLAGQGATLVPIVRADWLLAKILTTLDGGLYYTFAGVEASVDPKQTDQQKFLAALGADEERSKQLHGAQRAALFRSAVTGKPRRIDVFHGIAGRAGTGLIAVTHDIGDGDLDPTQDPLRNLLRFLDKAREVIAERPNGTHLFALFNNFGKLQQSVPDDVAADHTIPAPHSRRLQPAISCIRCHGADDGFKPFTNDVGRLLGGRLDVFGEGAQISRLVDEEVARLAEFYADDLAKPLRRARDDYETAVFRSARAHVKDVSAKVAGIYAGYAFDQVTPAVACLELGQEVDAAAAPATLERLWPPLAADETGLAPEDPMLAALKAAIPINRSQWELVYADAALRAAIAGEARP